MLRTAMSCGIWEIETGGKAFTSILSFPKHSGLFVLGHPFCLLFNTASDGRKKEINPSGAHIQSAAGV